MGRITYSVGNGWWLALVLLCTLPAGATTVYRSVDDNGVVSFSDAPPGNAAQVETLEVVVPEPADSEATRQRLEAMRETTDRMAADRMAREKHRAELRQIDAETAALEQSQAPYPEYDARPTVISGGYYDYPRYHHRPRPVHPIARPPLRPGHKPPGHIRPLPGNDYPASLVRRHYMPPVRAVFQR